MCNLIEPLERAAAVAVLLLFRCFRHCFRVHYKRRNEKEITIHSQEVRFDWERLARSLLHALLTPVLVPNSFFSVSLSFFLSLIERVEVEEEK